MITNVMERLIDFTRTSGGGYFGSDGLYRFTPASKNLLTYTQEFDNAAWGKYAVTVATNSTTAPDGTLTADAALPTATTATHNVQQAGGGSGTSLSLSVYAKAGSHAFMQLSHGSLSSIYANFNLLTGEVGTVGANATASITPAGDGWYRCAMTFTPGGAENLAIGHITSTTAGYRESWAATGTESIYLWGAQLELGSTATSYTRNVGGVYPPRFDYDPVTLVPRGLLIEEQRTNLLTYSEQFDNASWVKQATGTGTLPVVTANAAVAPDGTMTADQIVFDKGAGTTINDQSNIRVIITTTQVTAHSIWLRASAPVTIVMRSPFNNGTYSQVDVTTAWQRFTFTSPTPPASGTVFEFGLRASMGVVIPDAATVFAWGAQVEVGAFATSYIPTVASQVTRAADVAAITGANFSRWYIASEGTWVVEFDCSASSSALSADDATNNNFIRLGRLNNTGRLRVFSGGVEQADVTPANAPGWLGSVKLAAAYKANDFAASASGGTVSTDTVGAIPTVAQLRIGASGASDYVNGHIRSVRYFPTRLSNAKLQEITA